MVLDSPPEAGPGSEATSESSTAKSLAAVLEEGHAAAHLEFSPLTLVFRHPQVEGVFLSDVSSSRWPVLVVIFTFDCAIYLMRFAARVVGAKDSAAAVARGLVAQLLNMLLLYFFMALLNRRSRRSQSLRAAKQEEFLLALLMAVAISMLLLSLKPNSRDYVYAAFFLICATPLLKIRWLVGTSMLVAPVLLAAASAAGGWLPLPLPAELVAGGAASSVAAGTCSGSGMGLPSAVLATCGSGTLPWEAVVHLLVAWAVGGLMSFLLDTNRRQAFVNHTLALAAAEKELAEMRARAGVERELAAAQAQAAARALVVAREKASNEAKSEFMSLMCHEVRTPLNGCLASAEMLLETDLTAEQHDLARTIRVSGSILLSTVSNFLDFFKMEAGKQLDIVRTPLDLRDLVADVHCIIEAMIGRDGAVALLEPDLSDVPPTVMGDPNRVCGILLNLYTNAAKFTKQGAIGLRVRVVGEAYRPDVETAVQFFHSSVGGGSPRGSPHASESSGAATDALPSTSLPSSLASSDSEQPGPLEALGGGSCSNGGGPAGGVSSRRASWQLEPSVGVGLRRGGRREDDALQEAAPGAGTLGAGPASGSLRQARPSLQYEYESQWKSSASLGPGASGGGEAEGGARQASRGGSRPGSKLATPGGAGVGSPATAGFMRSSAEFDSAQSLPAAALLAQQVEEEVVAAGVMPSGAMEVVSLGDGWTSVCSHAAAPRNSAGSSEGEEPVGAGGERQWLAFEVQDTGVGVASRGMDSLFQDYVQGTDLEMRRARSRGGTGLGLSICSKQAAVLGGQIGALSKPNCGSVFWFTIPLRVPTGTAAAAAAAPAAPAGAASGVEAAGSPRPGRPSLEGELTQLWGGAASVAGTDGSGGQRRTSITTPRSNGSGEGRSAAAPSHGNSFGWYHLPPAGGGAARTSAANRLRAPTPGEASGAPGSGAAALAAAVPAPVVTKPTPAAAGAYAHAGRGYGLWVLLAEDNLINQTVARKMLSALGMKCQVASNGREAVDAVQRAHESGMNFDVVLMDMCMPVLSGVDATKAIRQLGCATPIVAMTANASERDRQECLAAGMNGFLSKPVLKDKLLDAIMAATEGRVET